MIHDRFDGMRKTCQWIALFLTQNPNDVAVNSANATAEPSGYHASVTDPEARLYKKSLGRGAMLCFMGHTLMENRNGLIVQAQVTQADGRAEHKAALEMIHRPHRV